MLILSIHFHNTAETPLPESLYSFALHKIICMRNKLYLTFILVGIYILLSFNSFAAKVFGVVRDEKNEPLIGAVVVLKGLEKGTQTDVDGKYEFDNVEDGTYEIVFSMVTYKKVLKTITVLKGKDIELNVVLAEEGNKKLTDVTVKANKITNTENAVMMEIRKSNAVVSGISAQQIAKTMDRNAADVVKRVPGVTIMDDQFIMVRGLNDRYNAVWLNDVGAPSSEVDKKAFSFDMIPSGQIDRIMVFKTPSPELPGDFAGGMVKIYTTSIPAKNTYSIGFQGSSREGSTGTTFAYNKRSKTDWLGYDDGGRSMPVQMENIEMLKRANSDINNLSKTFTNNWGINTKNQSPDIRFNASASNIINLKKLRIGNTFSVSYSNTSTNFSISRYDWDSVTAENQFADRASVNNANTALMDNIAVGWGNNKIEFKNLYNQLGRSVVVQRSSLPDSSRSDSRSYVMGYESRAIYSTQLTGTHKSRDESRQYNWSIGYNDLFRNMPDLRRITYNKLITQPDSAYQAAVPSGSVDPVNGGGRVYAQLYEKNYSFSHQYTQRVKLFKAYEFQVSLGNYLEQKNRAYRLREFGYVLPGGVPILQKRRLLQQNINEIFADSNIGVTNRFKVEENTRSTDRYDAKNQLIASFISVKLPLFSQKMTVLGGVRHEYNEYNLISYNTAGDIVNPIIKTSFFLPSINVSYNLNDKSLIRAAYGKTLNRPEFRENSPFYFYDMENRWGVYGAMHASEVNGPKGDTLDVAKIDNFDARWEWYPSSSELIQAGVFYKKIKDPIQAIINHATGDGRSFSFANLKEAYSYGLEIDIRKNLSFFDNWLGSNLFKDFQFIGNAAWIKSTLITDSTKAAIGKMPLQGQSPYMYNAGLYYQGDSIGLSATLVYNVFGPRVFAIGLPQKTVGSIWELPFNSLDLIIAKKLYKRFTVSIGVQNILDQKVRQYIDSDYDNKINTNYETDKTVSDRPSTVYKPGRYFTFGIKCKL